MLVWWIVTIVIFALFCITAAFVTGMFFERMRGDKKKLDELEAEAKKASAFLKKTTMPNG
ncbi:MAG: hypothetical protein WC310_05115 [Patescibacteria group bacterium]|jgi:phosphotransferase system  glucose/maltose/N-acetylglucosamine-specific IIC component